MLVQPDVADVSGPIRYARPRADARLRVALVFAWAALLTLAVELPLWLAGRGSGREVAAVNHHHVVDGSWAFVPRGHAVADFAVAAELEAFYAGMGTTEGLIARLLGTFLLGLLSGAGMQLLLGQLGGRLRRRREQLALFAWLAGSMVLIRACLLWVPLAATWIPVAALLVPVAVQLGRRVAFGSGLALALAASVMVPPFDPVLGLTLAAQGTALAFVTPRPRRAGWRWMAPFLLASSGAATLGYLAGQLLFAGGLDPLDLASAEWGRLSVALFAGLFWPLVGLAIDPVFERGVGNLGRSALLELSDLNNPILQRISKRAPGTWAHSRAMANLAESAAHAVGADALLIRVGAYYHDLGKADEPAFFIENLPRGATSPHEALSPEASAQKIIHHVRSSVARGRAAGLPEPIIDFMHTHHGSSRVEYFHQKARSEADDPERVDASRFTYPGAKPDSPETGILMIVDSVEAASRTLEKPDRKQLEGLLRQIVFSKLMAEQLDECGLSLHDMRRMVETLIDTILASAHDRITYPWQEEEREAEAEAKSVGAVGDAGSGAARVEPEDSMTTPFTPGPKVSASPAPGQNLRVIGPDEPKS